MALTSKSLENWYGKSIETIFNLDTFLLDLHNNSNVKKLLINCGPTYIVVLVIYMHGYRYAQQQQNNHAMWLQCNYTMQVHYVISYKNY